MNKKLDFSFLIMALGLTFFGIPILIRGLSSVQLLFAGLSMVTLGLISWMLGLGIGSVKLTDKLRNSFRLGASVGVGGFFVGFIVPMIVSPDAPLGPVIGFIYTGPISALAGAALGAILKPGESEEA